MSHDAAFQQHRALLFSIAYRMLGSVADAEDMLQETYLRWRKTPAAEVREPRAFLVTIVSRLSLNHLDSARARREQYVGSWLPEPLATGPEGDPSEPARVGESLSMAFLLLMERLSPVERAVFLLREVFDYEYPEIARILDQTEANCRQILSRARQHVAEDRPRFHPSMEAREELLHEFVDASEKGDMQRLLALLSSDVVLYADGGGKATAVPNPIRGRRNVARFVSLAPKKLVPPHLVRSFARINGLPGIVNYFEGRPHSVVTLDIEGGQVRAIYIVSNPEKLSGLPALPQAPC
ncbi:MAG TPA: RNA polymerase sigma-70 factor [Verrucomicrobiae bacterium]|nr:RNA polymerase sigma-70 factor [Verrucomicrobiae bacterium]